MARPVVAIALGLVVGAFGLAACGSSSGDSAIGKGSPSLSMPEYIERADAICAEQNEKIRRRQATINRLLAAPDTDRDRLALPGEFREIAKEVRAGNSRFRALAPPAGQRRPIETMLVIKKAEADLAESIADAVASEDQAEFQSLVRQLDLDQEKYRALMQGLGFKTCGHSRRS